MFYQLSRQDLDAIEDNLIQGIRDCMSQNDFSCCHLGLSGGLDSALVAYLAVRAVGKENVVCFILPSRFTPPGTLDDAAAMANNLGCRSEMMSIEPLYALYLETLEKVFEGRPFDTAEENLQSRIRGTLLMAFSNKFRSMLLATGNKSELAMGYCTLYGDMNGSLTPIGDLFKTEVFALCRRINEKSRLQSGQDIIPVSILTKPPSAELRPNQTDQDTLPPYEVLDAVLDMYLRQRLHIGEIARTLNLDSEFVHQIIRSVESAEFKRRQAPPVLKISLATPTIACSRS
jgi:NAD+ synthase (glutamine-hydrolysing)